MPIAEKFNNGTYKKPLVQRGEFFKGGVFQMQKRLQRALHPFPGAYDEFVRRTEDLSQAEIINTMWDYVTSD